jgi:hypothetical protein
MVCEGNLQDSEPSGTCASGLVEAHGNFGRKELYLNLNGLAGGHGGLDFLQRHADSPATAGTTQNKDAPTRRSFISVRNWLWNEVARPWV